MGPTFSWLEFGDEVMKLAPVSAALLCLRICS